MPIYTCLKCGQRVMSKNIHTRHSWPIGDTDNKDDMSLLCLGANSYIKEVEDEHKIDGKDAMIRITIRKGQTMEDAVKEFITLFTGLSEKGQKQYLCGTIEGHQWDEGDSPPTV